VELLWLVTRASETSSGDTTRHGALRSPVRLIAALPRPSTAMNATKIEPTKSPKNPEPATVPAPVSAVAQQPAANGTPAKPAHSGREGKRILSVAIPDKLARQLKLLCSVEGTTAAAIVITAVQRAVDKRLGPALESIKSDVDSEG